MVNASLLTNTEAIGQGLSKATIGFGSTLYLLIWLGLIVLILGGIGLFLWWYTSFKHSVKIKEKIRDNQFLIMSDKAKRKITPEGEFWKLRRRKALILAPPSEALEVSANGHYYAECVHNEKSGLDSGYDWITSTIEGKLKIHQSQEERALLADRLRRVQERKSRSLLDVIMQMSGMIFAVIIVVAFLAFYGDITKSIEDANREQAAAFARLGEITDKQIVFQDELNDLYSQLTCTAPTDGVDIPLDQSVTVG